MALEAVLAQVLTFRKPEGDFYKSALLTWAGQPYFHISVPFCVM